MRRHFTRMKILLVGCLCCAGLVAGVVAQSAASRSPRTTSSERLALTHGRVSHWLTTRFRVFGDTAAHAASVTASTAEYPGVARMLAIMGQADDPGQTRLGLVTAATVSEMGSY